MRRVQPLFIQKHCPIILDLKRVQNVRGWKIATHALPMSDQPMPIMQYRQACKDLVPQSGGKRRCPLLCYMAQPSILVQVRQKSVFGYSPEQLDQNDMGAYTFDKGSSFTIFVISFPSFLSFFRFNWILRLAWVTPDSLTPNRTAIFLSVPIGDG
jgi:hypothetical protein